MGATARCSPSAAAARCMRPGWRRSTASTRSSCPPPRAAFSALGCLTADQSPSCTSGSVRLALDGLDPAALEQRRAALRRSAMAPLAAAPASPRAPIELELRRPQALRGAERHHRRSPSPCRHRPRHAPRPAFHARHRTSSTATRPTSPASSKALRVRASKPSRARPNRPSAAQPRTAGRQADSARRCSFPGARRRRRPRSLARDGLVAPVVVAGPAIVADAWSTIVIPPGWHAAPDRAAATCRMTPERSVTGPKLDPFAVEVIRHGLSADRRGDEPRPRPLRPLPAPARGRRPLLHPHRRRAAASSPKAATSRSISAPWPTRSASCSKCPPARAAAVPGDAHDLQSSAPSAETTSTTSRSSAPSSSTAPSSPSPSASPTGPTSAAPGR